MDILMPLDTKHNIFGCLLIVMKHWQASLIIVIIACFTEIIVLDICCTVVLQILWTVSRGRHGSSTSKWRLPANLSACCKLLQMTATKYVLHVHVVKLLILLSVHQWYKYFYVFILLYYSWCLRWILTVATLVQFLLRFLWVVGGVR